MAKKTSPALARELYRSLHRAAKTLDGDAISRVNMIRSEAVRYVHQLHLARARTQWGVCAPIALFASERAKRDCLHFGSSEKPAV